MRLDLLKVRIQMENKETINHPPHYGGEDNTYEAIKVIEAWDLNFRLGNCIKYIARHKTKDNSLQDLKKALWYLQREIEKLTLEGKEWK